MGGSERQRGYDTIRRQVHGIEWYKNLVALNKNSEDLAKIKLYNLKLLKIRRS